MSGFLLSPRADARLDEIYVYTERQWGEAQAAAYVEGLYDCFRRIAEGRVVGRSIPAEFGVSGRYVRHERHLIYWQRFEDGEVGIVALLHESMHQLDRFKEDAS